MASELNEGRPKPDEKTLREAGELEVLDESGNAIKFNQLYNTGNRTIIVFIRHFFCGHCEDYVRALSTQFPPKDLERLSPTTTITIIGCGEPSTIAGYRARTSTSLPIYCDPSRKLYAKLGMTSSLSLGNQRPSYVQSSILGGTFKSMSNMLGAGLGVFKGGDYSQNGGEWVFVEGRLKWFHRMKNTRDHAEIAELGEALGSGINQ